MVEWLAERCPEALNRSNSDATLTLHRANLPTRRIAPDASSIMWDGKRYPLEGPIRRKVLALLWKDYEGGGAGLSDDYLQEHSGSSAERFRVEDLFRRKGSSKDKHPLLAKGILRKVGGAWRLGE